MSKILSNFYGNICGIFILIALTNADTTTKPIKITQTENVIKRPQQGSLEKFMRMSPAYVMPTGVSQEEYYEKYKNETPKAIELKSPNYPSPYPVGEDHKYPITVENSTGIEIIIHVLDIDPVKDFLMLTPVNNEGEEIPGLILKGKLSEPLKLRTLRTTKLNIVLRTGASQDHTYKGFLLTYKPFGEIPPPTTPPPDVTIPFDDLETYSELLTVPKEMQTNTTWSKIRMALSNATNNYISSFELKLEPCQTDNITIKSVVNCPDNWPGTEACIDFAFAISLYPKEETKATVDPFLQDSTVKVPAGLSRNQLERMWVGFGEAALKTMGINRYEIPDAKSPILMWVGICLGVAMVGLILVMTLCRLNAFRDYWPSTDDETQEIKEAEADISMFPSPDQVTPALFPNIPSYGEQYSESSIMDSLRRSSGFNGVNLAFIEDDECVPKRSNSQTYVKGVARDEVTT